MPLRDEVPVKDEFPVKDGEDEATPDAEGDSVRVKVEVPLSCRANTRFGAAETADKRLASAIAGPVMCISFDKDLF